MKQTSFQTLRTFFAICMVGMLVLSCKKDEPFYQVDAFETELHRNVNKYRQSQGLSDLVFFHDLFIEARQQSTAWKDSGDPTSGLFDRMNKITEHWKPVTPLDVITSTINSKDTVAARLVVEYWIQDSTLRSIITDDHIQSGPGISVGDNDKVFITHFFMKIHD